MRYLWGLVVFSVLPGPLLGIHKPILPRPQQIEYRSGRLSLRGLSIGFGSTASAEDEFAAKELSSALSLEAGTTIPVVATHPATPCITLVRTGAVDALPGGDDQPGPRSREAYEIRIGAQGAEIRAQSSAGLYYGVQTLHQLVEGDPGNRFLPEVSIRDWPAMAYRGFMMDMSHGPLPTEAEVKRQIDFLARWKANQYYFYSEASVELAGYDLVNPQGRFAQEQVRRLITYARERHMDVVPMTELYGHMHDLFRIERYADLSLLPHGDEIDPLNKQTQALLVDWTRQLAALFPSPWFYIGFDEPWSLEKARSLLGDGADPLKLYTGQMKRTADLLQKLGKRPMFAPDLSGSELLQRYPDLISELPKEAIAVPWHFERLQDYSPYVAPLAKEHIPVVVGPGIWCWNEIAPSYSLTFWNIDGFLRAGHKYGALGLMNMGWTDAGQVLYRTTLPGMAYGAVAAWQSPSVDQSRFFSDYASLMYPPNAASEVASGLEKLDAAEGLIMKIFGGQDTIYRFWEDPLTPDRLQQSEANRDAFHQERLLAEDAEERFRRALSVTNDTYSLPSFVVAARMLDYAGMKYLYAIEIGGFFKTLGRHPSRSDVLLYLFRESSVADHGRIEDLMDAITALREDYRSAWRQEYTDYRLGTELGRWDTEYEFWRRFQARLWEAVNNFKDGDTLPTLEDLRPRLPMAGSPP